MSTGLLELIMQLMEDKRMWFERKGSKHELLESEFLFYDPLCKDFTGRMT